MRVLESRSFPRHQSAVCTGAHVGTSSLASHRNGCRPCPAANIERASPLRGCTFTPPTVSRAAVSFAGAHGSPATVGLGVSRAGCTEALPHEGPQPIHVTPVRNSPRGHAGNRMSRSGMPPSSAATPMKKCRTTPCRLPALRQNGRSGVASSNTHAERRGLYFEHKLPYAGSRPAIDCLCRGVA